MVMTTDMNKFSFLAILFLIASCATERISNQNLAFLYDKGAAVLKPHVAVRHLNDSVARLEFRIHSTELLYSQNPVSKFWSAELRLRYEVQDRGAIRVLSDSAMVLFRDSALILEDKYIRGYLDLKPSKVQFQALLLDITDVRRGARDRNVHNIDRSNANAHQHYFLQREGDRDMLFRNHIGKDEAVIVRHSDFKQSQAKVYYYGKRLPTPPPPFSVEPQKPLDLRPDTTFTIELGRPLKLEREGLYHVKVNDTLPGGLVILRFDEGFPEVKTVRALVEPMRYINSNQEFKRITDADYPKTEVDQFWLKTAGSPDRAKTLIGRFYGRVQLANEYFTAHTEGWKTDRGIVYIVFGPPNTLYKNQDSEYWVYGDEGSMNSVGFTFVRMDNQFTNNDYRLDRSPIYKNNWYRAVDSWRQGRVYSDN